MNHTEFLEGLLLFVRGVAIGKFKVDALMGGMIDLTVEFEEYIRDNQNLRCDESINKIAEFVSIRGDVSINKEEASQAILNTEVTKSGTE